VRPFNVPSTIVIPREGSLLLAPCGSLRIACEPIVFNWAWNLIFGINHQAFGRVQRFPDRRAAFGPCEILRGKKRPPAHGASRSPATKNGFISLYSRIFTAGAAEPLPRASARNACSDCATMARARSFL
jgi:hypothetical protein